MIERIEVTAGPGTVIRYGGIVAWADPSASPALISFLAQSARNLGPSSRGGRQIADHIATVLATHDPEPHVAFAVVGPSDHGWASLLHGPSQAWDGSRWLAPAPSPGWLQAIITPRPAITVNAAGAPTPAVAPDAMWDLEAGVVPGSGFVLVPGATPGRFSVVRPVTATQSEPEPEPEPESDQAEPEPEPQPESDQAEAEPDQAEPELEPVLATSPRDAGLEAQTIAAAEVAAGLTAALAVSPLATAANAEEVEAEPEPEPVPPRPVVPGPAGSLDLRTVTATASPPLPRGGGPDQRVPGAPVVAGILCERGHLNRPGLLACARCRVPIPAGAREQVSGTRPPLGVLVADDGTIYRLDRSYLVGSNSERDPTVGGGLARPLTLAGSDVSGSHAELRLTDWDVTIVDRGSTVGTCVFEPGAGEWARLSAYEPRVIPPGTHMAFGQRVITFISPWVPAG